MRNILLAFAIMLTQGYFANIFAQDLSNRISVKKSVTEFFNDSDYQKKTIWKNNYIALIEFEKTPNAKEQALLKSKGIALLSFHENNSYWAKISSSVNSNTFSNSNIKSISTGIEGKSSPTLRQNNFVGQTIDVVITLHKELDHTPFLDFLEDHNCNDYSNFADTKNVFIIELDGALIDELLTLPVVSAMDLKQEPDQPMNFETKVSQRVSAVGASFPGGLNLDGSGVVIGVGDGGELGDHIDFAGRVINMADGTYPSFGAHGDHVAGIVGAGGNLNPKHQGMAPGADLVIEKTSMITNNAVTYLQDHGMVVTNNSYGVSFDCETNGTYNYSSAQLDNQLHQNPELLHVFASGNSGVSQCGDYPSGYFTVLRFYQAAKNVLTVGNTNNARAVVTSSSKGPVLDGRIKPELVGVGMNVYSTGRDFDYYASSGTSMASPAVTGALGLLYQRYKEVYGGVNPDGALIKAIACNTADDIHEAGPDFKSGFGAINIKRAADLITDGNFISGSISHGNQNTHMINVPANVKHVKIMLYWHDVEAAAFPVKALVNDIDLKVTDPTNTNYLPWVLDHTPANVANLATRMEDHLNNIEQVTIDDPAPGNFALVVNGYDVPVGNQNYYVVYEYIYDEVEVVFPYGGESFEPGRNLIVHWDADVTNTSLFNVQFSSDGTNWTTIAPGVGAHVRSTAWTVPDLETSTAYIRVVKASSNVQNQNQIPFNILPSVTELTAEPYCDGYIRLKWNGVDYADDYEVMYLGDEKMIAQTIVNDTDYVFANNFILGDRFWFSIRPVLPNGTKGARIVADDATALDLGFCPWDNDISVTIRNPIRVGRRFTSGDVGTTDMLNVIIKNVGANNVNDIPISYSVDGGPIKTENCSPTLAPGDSINFNFPRTNIFENAGEYQVNYWANLPEDEHNGNDSIVNIAKVIQLPNERENLPYKEDFNSINPFKIERDKIGLDDLIKWDFKSGSNGEIICKQFGSNQALVMDYYDQYDLSLAPVSNDAIMTINLSGYNTGSAKVVLGFSYLANYAPFNGEVFMRGSDTGEWIPLMTLGNTTMWKEIEDVKITESLRVHGQNFSSSFQLKFAQYNGDVIFDNIQLALADPLPIEMSYFKALRDGDDVLLQWGTAYEYNADYFEIEMANSFEDFAKDLSKVIAKVDAKGNSTEPTTYRYLDDSPNTSINRYYRLKQFDLDGSFTYSDFRVVFFEDRIEDKMAFFPNPFMDVVQFHYKSNENQEVQVIVSDVNGADLMSFNIPIYEGEQDVVLDVDKSLPSGVYIFRVVSTGKVHSFPLIKTEL